MIGTETISRVIGQDVYDRSGARIGSAAEVYLDDETGRPEWVTVRTGLFGTRESFVPIRDADLTGDGLRVSVAKERVKDAPRIDADGHLSPQDERELYRYYGRGAGPSTGLPGTTGRGTVGRARLHGYVANVGDALDGPVISREERGVTLPTERPVVEKEVVPVERIRLDEDTVTDQEQVSADVREEQVEVEGAADPDRRR